MRQRPRSDRERVTSGGSWSPGTAKTRPNYRRPGAATASATPARIAKRCPQSGAPRTAIDPDGPADGPITRITPTLSSWIRSEGAAAPATLTGSHQPEAL